jgi:hypothetical protein
MNTTANGTAFAPVVDIAPQLAVSVHDHRRVRREMELLKAFGFDRVYFVLANPGYPQFSNPWLALIPPDLGTENHTFESILQLGDPNFAYLKACHDAGMEAWAIIKPYEGGGGSTVPDGANVPFGHGRAPTIGGERIYFDALLSQHPEYRVIRRPDAERERLSKQPIRGLELAFCAEPFTDGSGHSREVRFDPQCPEHISEIKLYLSRDNGSYVRYMGPITIIVTNESRTICNAIGESVFAGPKDCYVLRVRDLDIPEDVSYLAVTIGGQPMPTIPHSMLTLVGPEGTIPTTVSPYVRTCGSAEEQAKPVSERRWGIEQQPRAHFGSTEEAANAFAENGFEFDWHGSGFWGQGWRQDRAYGLARGKMAFMKGTACEAIPEVRQYWLDWVDRCVAMGFDGVDVRLQSHSAMVSDYTEFGYNQPIVDRYRELHGIDILKAKADPLEVMRIRGEFFTQFLEEAADLLHGAGRKLQIHLRHAHEEPKLSHDFNELGFWAMPKIRLDWEKAVDLADEITLKHYYHNDYRPTLAKGIRERARAQGKPVWIHCYIAQGRELNDTFIDLVDGDREVAGVLLYETAHSSKNENNLGLIEQYGPVGYNQPVADDLNRILGRLGYRLP